MRTLTPANERINNKLTKFDRADWSANMVMLNPQLLTEGVSTMSLQNHTHQLKMRYDILNERIRDELSRPLPNSLSLFELKMKRLRLADQLAAIH